MLVGLGPRHLRIAVRAVHFRERALLQVLVYAPSRPHLPTALVGALHWGSRTLLGLMRVQLPPLHPLPAKFALHRTLGADFAVLPLQLAFDHLPTADVAGDLHLGASRGLVLAQLALQHRLPAPRVALHSAVLAGGGVRRQILPGGLEAAAVGASDAGFWADVGNMTLDLLALHRGTTTLGAWDLHELAGLQVMLQIPPQQLLRAVWHATAHHFEPGIMESRYVRAVQTICIVRSDEPFSLTDSVAAAS